MAKFRKKPIVIEAIRYEPETPCNLAEVARFIGVDGFISSVTGDVVVSTLEGAMYASPGDWLIRGIQNELYPCKADIFEATYERVNEEEFA